MNPRDHRRLLAILVCLAGFALGGCASLRARDDAAKDADAEDKTPPPVRLEVRAPGDLKKLLETHLDLARLPKLAAGEPVPPGEIDRLIAATPAQARDLLETEGYFNADVSAQRLPDGEIPTVRVTVEPGPQAHVRDLDLQVRGPLAEATQRGEPFARDAQRAFRNRWPLPPGSVFRNPDWSSAKRSALADLRANAYLDADWASTSARVDAQTHEVDLALIADSGPLYRTGPLRIRGLQHHDEQTVRNLADFDPGTPATEERLLDYQERLQRSGLFSRATVTVDPQAADPDAAPVNVRLGETPLQEATVGLGVSSDVGARGTLEHVHRRVFGRALTARNRFELSNVRQSWEGELSTHTLPGLYRNLIGGAYERIESDEDVVTSERVRVGRAQDTKHIDRLYFLQAERSLRRTATTRERSDAISGHYHGIWRKVDNVLLPTDGYVLSGQLGGGQATSDPGGAGPFARAYARLHGYWPIGSWYSQARLELGQVFVRSGVIVPESMRFRAGGSDSVRGYAYRSLTPVVNGVQTSGKLLFTTSFEIAHPILASLPQLWGAAFIDAGRAADRWSDLKPAVGVGVGVRYRSPIGPLALDVAYGEEEKRFRLHLSVGVTF